MRRRKKAVQLAFRYKGEGRTGRPKKPDAGVPHLTRPEVARRFPVHVTIRVKAHVWNLRSFRSAKVLRRAFVAAAERHGTRLCHFSVQGNHLHLIAETEDRTALARALKGLGVRVARGMNKLMRRRGAVLADRYHARILRSPTEVRRALVYVLNNARHREARPIPAGWIDPFSSARYFDGWRSQVADAAAPEAGAPVRSPRTWLLAKGWRLRGLVDPGERPG